MGALTVSAADIRPLPGCIMRRFVAGATVRIGRAVYLSAADTVTEAIGTSVAAAAVIGIAVATPDGGTSATIGKYVDVVLLGPVAGFTDAIYGAYYYISDTVGIMHTTTGTASTIVGQGLSLTTFLVRPKVVTLTL